MLHLVWQSLQRENQQFQESTGDLSPFLSRTSELNGPLHHCSAYQKELTVTETKNIYTNVVSQQSVQNEDGKWQHKQYGK